MNGELRWIALCRTCARDAEDGGEPAFCESDVERVAWTRAHLAACPEHDVVWREELLRQGAVLERLHEIPARISWTADGEVTAVFTPSAGAGGDVLVDATTGRVFEVVPAGGGRRGTSPGWARPADRFVETGVDARDPDDTGPLFGLWAPEVMPEVIGW